MKRLILINIVLVILVVSLPKIDETQQEETTGLIHNQSVTSRGEVERQPVKSYSLTIDMDLRKKSNLIADEYNAMLSGTKLKGIGSALEKAEKQYGINGLYLLGLCCLESGYGTSSYAVKRNNLVRMERS